MAKLTPMMEQYFEIKNDYKYCLLFFRLGDFYELFFEDAILASRELEITLTGRDCGQAERAPMCGVPYHAAEGYIAKLIEKGYKVAICEQVEDAKLSKSIVKREVVRVITPGTVMDSNLLEEGKNNYIACIFEDKTGFGLAFSDVSTGEFLTCSFKKGESKKIIDEIAKFNPAEIIVNDGFTQAEHIESIFNIKPANYNSWNFSNGNAYINLCNHFKVINLYSFGIEDNKLSISASGALIIYLSETQKNSLAHISTLKLIISSEYMGLDISSRKNLELTENVREKNKKGSLLWVLDKTNTAMGARLLRKWILQPLIQKDRIIERHDAVDEFKNDIMLREELKEILNTIYDIERLMGKVIYQTLNGRDLICLKNSIKYLPHFKNLMCSCKAPLIVSLFNSLDILEDVFDLIENSICEEPPITIREGGILKKGYSGELDKLLLAKNEGTTWLMELESKEKQVTGIKNLKVKYNKIFGYYFEVTNSYKNLVPEHFIRRQTLANCERYTTIELKEIEDLILGADDKISTLEYELFTEIKNKIAKQTERIQSSANIVATIDVILSLADVADKYNYVKPIIDETGALDIKEGRHPVVEQLSKQAFIPNDIYLDLEEDRLSIITGPNMAGKSTYMRQAALIVLMAHMGSFIPADSGRIGIVDQIFTRVGASDDLATGQSTFMVEMSEVSNIINNATSRSLLILDEIGRGTSTFDGLSIAWAVLEYIADKKLIGAKTLFATHYHELTELEGKVAGIKNYCITVANQGDDIIFLRKIARGGAEYSYGIHVAKLAGIPVKIINRSNEILNALNEVDIAKRGYAANNSDEIVRYRTKKNDNLSKHKIIINEINILDVDSLTPREALKALYNLQSKTKEIKEE